MRMHSPTSLLAMRSISSAANIRKIDDETLAAGSFSANASGQKFRDFYRSVCVCADIFLPPPSYSITATYRHGYSGLIGWYETVAWYYTVAKTYWLSTHAGTCVGGNYLGTTTRSLSSLKY